MLKKKPGTCGSCQLKKVVLSNEAFGRHKEGSGEMHLQGRTRSDPKRDIEGGTDVDVWWRGYGC